LHVVFFFQAVDGIRDRNVTGVQTCALPIFPILAGLLSSKAPFGPSMSFLIASPLLNPVIVILLWTLLGWKLTLYYVVIVGIFAVLIGVVWKALGLEHSVKNVNVRKAS